MARAWHLPYILATGLHTGEEERGRRRKQYTVLCRKSPHEIYLP